jgi:CheY-like chemotaxis protein
VDRNRTVILIADDDEDDCLLIKDVLRENGLGENVHVVSDGQDLMDYLLSCVSKDDSKRSPCPDLILLDLNMPKKDGREALAEIKADPDLRDIPIVVFTTSDVPRDIELCSRLEARAFITKPMYIAEWRAVVETVESILGV